MRLRVRRGTGGTRSPLLRASERPIAIACLRLRTFMPLRPLLSTPRLYSRITRATFLDAPREYVRDVRADDRLRAMYDSIRFVRECGMKIDFVMILL